MSVVVLGACQPPSRPLTDMEKETLAQEVRQTLGALTEAMNSHDSDRIFRYFQQTEEFLYLGCTSFMLGWDTFFPRARSYHLANRHVAFTREVIRVQVLSPTVAVAASQGGSTEVDALFWTDVLVKEGGSWRITYQHESWPGCSPPPVPHPFTSGDSLPGMTAPDTATAGEEDY